MGEYEKSACTGKERFTSYFGADRVMARRRRLHREAAKFKPYRCHSCHGWHLGAKDVERSNKGMREFLSRYQEAQNG